MSRLRPRIARAVGAVLRRNSLNESPREEPTIMLVGSPTIVATPPIFAARTSATTNGTGSISNPSNTWTVSGTAKSPVMMTVSGRERGSGITSRLGPRRIGLGHKRPHDCGRLQGMHPGGGSTTASEVGHYSFMAWKGLFCVLGLVLIFVPFF